MSESIYEKVNNRIDVFGEIVQDLVSNPEIQESIYKKYGKDILDHLKYISEIDQFKKEFHENNERYLKDFLDRYERIRMFLAFPDKSFKDRKSMENHGLLVCINQIIEHIEGLINPELGIQEPPQKFEKLKPFEKILIFHYLNEKNKLFKYPLNSKSGKYFLSRLLDINPESIKNPVDNISDYTTNQVTEKQAESFYKTLGKVKTFFDESELFEISKVIETRINVLKKKAGKD